MIDVYGRNINYLRVSITDRCNLRCVYCMPEKGVEIKSHEDILRFEEIIKIVNAAASLGINKIRYTGGEPLVVKDFDKLVYETSKIPEIEDIAITTNGILLSDMAESLKRAGLKRVNISLDTLDEDKFKTITRGGSLKKVMESIDKCIEIGLTPVKINTVLMKGFNDNEISDFLKLSYDMPLEIRFIELMPIGEGAKIYKNSRINISDVIAAHKELIQIENEKSSTAQLYAIPGAKGKIGIISPVSCKFCKDCNKIRLTSTGTIKQCLHSNEEIDLKPYIYDEALLTSALKWAIFNKPFEHYLAEENVSRTKRNMNQIGG